MAGDWIKMRANLGGDPAVNAMARTLKLDTFSVVGRLHVLWAWADQHTDDGQLPLTEPEDIDAVVCKRGFADEMLRVGWLEVMETGGVIIPNWFRHNGDSAKKRAMDMERQRAKRSRDCHGDVMDLSREERDASVTENGQLRDQRREEYNTPIVPLTGDGIKPGKSEPEPVHPLLARAKAIFHIRPGTKLDASQDRAWRKARPVLAEASEEDWLVVEAWHEADLPKREDYRRRDLATLLNNWGGEVIRARTWAKKTGFSAPTDRQKKEKGGPPDEIWRALLAERYPDGDPGIYRNWGELPASLQADLLADYEDLTAAHGAAGDPPTGANVFPHETGAVNYNDKKTEEPR